MRGREKQDDSPHPMRVRHPPLHHRRDEPNETPEQRSKRPDTRRAGKFRRARPRSAASQGEAEPSNGVWDENGCWNRCDWVSAVPAGTFRF